MVRKAKEFTVSKDKKKVSRRDFLFGGLRKVRKNVEETRAAKKEDFTALADATAGITKDDATTAKQSFEDGNRHYAKAEYDEASTHYRECVRLFPAHLEARKRLGYCFYQLGKHLQARVEFERILKAAKKDNFCSLYLGLCYARLGKAKKVLEAWQGYFNPEEVRIMRELNIQRALLESPEPPELEDVADSLEEAIMARKKQLLEEEQSA